MWSHRLPASAVAGLLLAACTPEQELAALSLGERAVVVRYGEATAPTAFGPTPLALYEARGGRLMLLAKTRLWNDGRRPGPENAVLERRGAGALVRLNGAEQPEVLWCVQDHRGRLRAWVVAAPDDCA